MRQTQWTDRYGSAAMVTGASSGIGEQFAHQLAEKGFDLLLTARRETLLESLKARLESEYGVNVSCCVCDLSDATQVDGLIEQAQSMGVGLVISNAGYGVAKGAFLSIAQEELEAMYRANSLAPGSTDTNAPINQGISRDQLVGIMSPAEVAQQALDHLGRQPHFTPGIHNRLFIALLGLLPKKLAISMAGYGMKRAMEKSSFS